MLFNLTAATLLFDVAEPFVIWGTVAIVGALLIAGVILYFAKREIFKTYLKYSLLGFIFYALAVGILMVSFNIAKRTDAGYMEENYLNADIITFVLVPLIAAMATVLICGVVLFVLNKKIDGAVFKKAAYIMGAICGLVLVAALVMIAVYYTNHIEDGGYYDGGDGEVNQAVLYIGAIALIIAEVAAAFVLGRKDKNPFDSRCIALAGICIALSFALSYIKLWEMPQGGSVTFVSLLPVMLFACVYGTKKGILVGFIYGLLQAIQDPYIIHPAQFMLDYPVAFAFVGFAGAFFNVKKLNNLPQVKFALGAVLVAALRFISHVISGVFAFSAYAAGQNVLIYSLAYNSFVFIDIALVLVAGVLLFSSKSFVKAVQRYSLNGVKAE